jgi:6-phosphogluconolactonase (cycloisomerase 2 family)
MKFRKFGKTVLTAALSSAIIFSLSSCVRSFTVGYIYVTGTTTATPSGNGIITGLKIDNNTGQTKVLHGFPTGSGGSNPVRAVLLSGGNFVYVLNAGTTASGGSTCTATDPCTNANITEFAVGGNGVLTFQQTFYTQGLNPRRLLADTSGTHLFVLDANAPGTADSSTGSSATNPNAYCGAAITGATSCGDITVFSVNSTTGRLTLVTNSQLTSSTGTQVTYFPVPSDPVDIAFTTSYLMTVGGPAGSPQTVYPYTYNASTGQLAVSQSTPQFINGVLNGSSSPVLNANAIVYAGGKVYVLDNDPTTTGGVPGQIIPFTIGTNGALQALVGGAVADDDTETSPIYMILEAKGKFIYVANQLGATSDNAAGIAIYSVDPSSGILTEAAGSPVPTASTGATPVCLLEDPSNQYIYTANGADSTVTGHRVDPKSGQLTELKTPSITLSGPATWCIVSGRTN